MSLALLAQKPINELYEYLGSSPVGLGEKALHNHESHTPKNIITSTDNNTVFQRLFKAFINPFVLLLIAIMIIDIATDIWSKENDFSTVIIILIMIFISTLVSFIQSERSSNATKKLSSLITNKVDVIRNGIQKEIDIEDVYPGDLIRLSAGDMVPADVRFVKTKDTFVGAAALTGESEPVEKFAENLNNEITNLPDIRNLGLMGSNIVSGTATAIVLTTGDNTYLGQMADSISSTETTTNFDRGVKSVSKLLIRFMLVMVPIVLIINGFDKHDWREALLFAISVAVGLTPEMLPVIMTSTLARGALHLSRKKVIVKNLNAIQGFGEMDILCTDKTGTLTEDRVVLERYIDVNGQDDSRILRYAYLNSTFQTGLKNLLDQSIINRAREEKLLQVKSRYHLVDEIPFDFSRRRMSVVLEDSNNKTRLITKGAVEEILEISSYIELSEGIHKLTDETKATALATYNRLSNQGLRVIAVAQKKDVPDASHFSVNDESEMTLIGFVGFLDPPKKSAPEAIAKLKKIGVRTVVLTGDAIEVSRIVSQKVGIHSDIVIDGTEVDNMSETELETAIHSCDVFAKLSPSAKSRIVEAFKTAGHTVGFMGDGINDAPALKISDVAISVDTAVDIAKETANIILLEKDLKVLISGVEIGRKTFGNIMKYIKLAVSGNFGNMLSVIIASIFLPFLPMLPVQILAQNMLCDFSQLAIPFDRVDQDYVKEPRKWEITSIKSFMFFMGPLSSIFDLLCFASLWFFFGFNTEENAVYFQSGWFLFGTISQILIIYTFRTGKIPFLQSWPAKRLLASTLIVGAGAITIALSNISYAFDMAPVPLIFLPTVFGLVICYALLAQIIKRIYQKKYNRWL